MPVKASTNRFKIDALTILDGPLNVPVTKTSTGASASFISLDVLTSYWDSATVAEELDMAVVVETTATSGTTPTFVFSVEVAPDAGSFSAPVTIGTAQAVSGVGRSVIVIDRDDIVTALAGATVGSLRLKATLGGTSPSISYTAYVSVLPGL